MLYFYRNETVSISSGGDYDLKSCYCKGRFKNHGFRRSQRFPLDGTSIWKLKISCHFLHFVKTENIRLKSALNVERDVLLTRGSTLRWKFTRIRRSSSGVRSQTLVVKFEGGRQAKISIFRELESPERIGLSE